MMPLLEVRARVAAWVTPGRSRYYGARHIEKMFWLKRDNAPPRRWSRRCARDKLLTPKPPQHARTDVAYRPAHCRTMAAADIRCAMGLPAKSRARRRTRRGVSHDTATSYHSPPGRRHFGIPLCRRADDVPAPPATGRAWAPTISRSRHAHAPARGKVADISRIEKNAHSIS